MDSTSTHKLAETTPTSYGRACKSCSRAKNKCLYQASGKGCERCHRLKKACQPSEIVRKRNFKKTSSSKTTQLHEKLDDLVSILRSQAAVKQAHETVVPVRHNGESSGSETLILTHDSVVTPTITTVRDANIGFPQFPDPKPVSISPHSAPDSSPFLISDDLSIYKISDATAEEQLSTFQQAFLPFFPFVYIPSHMSASDLRREKPFLCLVIMSLTTRSVALQVTMGTAIRQIVAQKVVVEHEKSLDILLGMICYIAWSQYHKKDKSYMTVWTQMVLALVFELGIHKGSQGDTVQHISKIPWFTTSAPVSQVRTIEERRAVLGAFVLASMVWTSLRKTEPLRWTPYMNECARILIENQETELDVLLTTQAKCHIIMDQMTNTTTEWAADGKESEGPPSYFVKVMQSQLQEIRQNLPIEIKLNTTVLLYLYSTELYVKESLLGKSNSQIQIGASDLQRLEGLESILTAAQRWLEVFFEVPLADWIGATCGIFQQFVHCIMLLSKLTIIDEPGWDIEEVKKRANLHDILDRAAQNLDSIPGIIGLVDAVGTGESGFLFKSSRLVQSLKATFLAKIAPAESQTDFQLDRNANTTQYIDESSTSDAMAMGFMDDQWLTDIFISSWDF